VALVAVTDMADILQKSRGTAEGCEDLDTYAQEGRKLALSEKKLMISNGRQKKQQ